MSLRVMDLRRHDLLRPPGQTPRQPPVRAALTWHDPRTADTAGFKVTGGSEQIVLDYRIGTSKADLVRCTDVIPIVWTPCRLGGARPWFLCPGSPFDCGRRVGALYAGFLRFACRHCHGLTYQSRRGSRLSRLLYRLEQIRAALGIPPGQSCPGIPKRPKGMHGSTYERLCRELDQVLQKADALVLDHLTGRLP